MEKLKNIGFLRVIFMLIIVIFHLLCQPNTLFAMYPDAFEHIHYTTGYAYLAVELFFVMAGFFLYFSAKKDISTKEFFVNKFVRLWAVPAFALFCIWGLSLINYTGYSKYANILHFLMLKNTGMTLCLADNGTAWFVSVLFWVSIFYFYLIKNIEKRYVNLIIGLISYFSMILLVQSTSGHFVAHYTMVNSFFNVGMLRGLSEMGIGYFIAMFTEDYLKKPHVLEKKNFWNIEFLIASVVELYLFIFVVQRLLFKFGHYTNDLVLLVFIVGLFVMFILKKGILSRLTDNNLFYCLGNYTFSIYVMQEVVFRVLNKTFWAQSTFVQGHPTITLLISSIITCMTGVIVYYIVEKPFIALFKNKVNKSPIAGGGGGFLNRRLVYI